MPSRLSSRRRLLWLDSEPLCTRHWSAPVEKGWAPSVVTADSGRHAGVADAMRARHRADAEARDDVLRQADFLVDLDHVAAAHDADLPGRSASDRPRAALSSLSVGTVDDGMGRP